MHFENVNCFFKKRGLRISASKTIGGIGTSRRSFVEGRNKACEDADVAPIPQCKIHTKHNITISRRRDVEELCTKKREVGIVHSAKIIPNKAKILQPIADEPYFSETAEKSTTIIECEY